MLAIGTAQGHCFSVMPEHFMSLVMDDIADIIEFYIERAAVFEFDAGFERKHAEVLALQEVKKHYGEQAKRRVQMENRKHQEGQL